MRTTESLYLVDRLELVQKQLRAISTDGALNAILPQASATYVGMGSGPIQPKCIFQIWKPLFWTFWMISKFSFYVFSKHKVFHFWKNLTHQIRPFYQIRDEAIPFRPMDSSHVVLHIKRTINLGTLHYKSHECEKHYIVAGGSFSPVSDTSASRSMLD